MQSSCNVSSFPAFSLPALGLQRRPQLREMAVSVDPPQTRLDEAQRTGYPALFLVRRVVSSGISIRITSGMTLIQELMKN